MSNHHPDYVREILGERIEDHHDVFTCPSCRASGPAEHLNHDGTCPACDAQVVCAECHDNTVAAGDDICATCAEDYDFGPC